MQMHILQSESEIMAGSDVVLLPVMGVKVVVSSLLCQGCW